MIQTLGSKIDELYKVKEEIKKVSELKKIKTDMEKEIFQCMIDMGITKSSGKLASVAINISVIPVVKDWHKVYNYIHREKRYYLLRKQIVSAAFKDELDSRNGRAIPGIEIFEKESLGCRKL